MSLNYLSDQKQGRRVSVREISDKLGLPFDPLSRVMQKMVHREWLDSGQGLKGGYLLIQQLHKISLLELSETLEGKLATVKCLEPGGECELSETCNIKSSTTLLQNKMKDFYKLINVAELLGSHKKEEKHG